jgi:DNA-directed RNA polymerase specialized sigma24 family protein
MNELDDIDALGAEYVLGTLSREALAKQFDRPEGTIKTWLHRSLAQLKGCLEL